MLYISIYLYLNVRNSTREWFLSTGIMDEEIRRISINIQCHKRQNCNNANNDDNNNNNNKNLIILWTNSSDNRYCGIIYVYSYNL